MRLLHLSDIHVWRWPRRVRDLFSKRVVAMIELASGRAAAFQLDRLPAVVDRAVSLRPDHVLISGDLSMSSLPDEFAGARDALSPLLADPARATVLPGNHDRYTRACRREFERHFGAFLGAQNFPWLRMLGDGIVLIGLDPCRPHLTATGKLPAAQLDAARVLLASHPAVRPIIACHYPLDAPEQYQHELRVKRMVNAASVAGWLAGIGPHLYCCGHVHSAWAVRPGSIPGQLCLNSGAPLRRDDNPARRPGFLEILLKDRSVHVTHHAWDGTTWNTATLAHEPSFWTS